MKINKDTNSLAVSLIPSTSLPVSTGVSYCPESYQSDDDEGRTAIQGLGMTISGL
jgi:hypothetical protein